MLTPAVSRRAASVGILTAQVPKTKLGSNFSFIAGTGTLFQSHGKCSTFASIGRQEPSHTPSISRSPNILARPFHVSTVYRPNCDIGLPCNCPECVYDLEDDRWSDDRERNPICEKCKVNPTAYKYVYEDYKRLTLEYISYCENCTENIWEEERKQEENNKKIKAAHEEKVNKMLEHVQSLPPGQQVPITYAVDKVSSIWADKSAALRHKDLRNSMSEELKIVKVRNRWKCDKGRVDAMNFELWRDRFTVSGLETSGYRYVSWLEYNW